MRIKTSCAQFLFYYLVVHLPLQPCDLFSTFVRKLQVSRLGTGDWMDSHCVFVVFNSSCPHIQTPEYHWNYQGGNNKFVIQLSNLVLCKKFWNLLGPTGVCQWLLFSYELGFICCLSRGNIWHNNPQIHVDCLKSFDCLKGSAGLTNARICESSKSYH